MSFVKGLAALAVAAALVTGAKPARADIIFAFIGTVERLEYNQVPVGTPSPFEIGETVVGEILIPGLVQGRFAIGDFGVLLDSDLDGTFEQRTLGTPTHSFLQFGATAERIVQNPGNTRADGFYPEQNGLLITSAFFCCNFQGAGRENADAWFTGDSFVAHFLPTGPTVENVAAYGSGRWYARAVPEPGAIGVALLALGLLAMVGAGRSALPARARLST